MTVSATRKVSASTPLNKKPERIYGLGAQSESFVEAIDASVAVGVKEKSEDERNQEYYQKPKQEQQSSVDISADSAYVPGTIEALSADGVFEEIEETARNVLSKVGIYSNNQSMMKDKNVEQRQHEYVKHFYENNELLEEVDKLV